LDESFPDPEAEIMKRKKRLRVAMLIDAWFPFYGGGQVHVRKLREVLEKKYNVDVELFYSASSNLIIRFFWALIVSFQVWIEHKKKSFDLIHSHAYIAGLPGKILSLKLKIPVVHTVHGSSLLDRGLKTPKAWFEKYLLTKVAYDAQITVSTNFLDYMNVNKNIYVIHNGVDVKRFDGIRVRKSKNPRLIWVGRDDPVKGLKYLKQAILRVRKKLPRLEAVLVTGGKIFGDELVREYKKSHLFVLPSLAEGQPLTLLEAWAAKLPVVVTDVGENSSLVKDAINGYLVDAKSVNQLERQILKVLRSKDKGKRMGLAGYRLVASDYSWEKMVGETVKVYRSLVK